MIHQTVGEGNRDWITLLNGRTRTSSDFQAMAKHLAREGWRVLLVENKGTLKNPARGAFTLSDCAKEIEKTWQTLGIAKSHVLGISYGGTIAQTLALEFPGRVSSLILVSTSPKAEWISEVKSYFSESFTQKNSILVKSLLKEMDKAFADPAGQAQATFQTIALKGFDSISKLSQVKIPTLILHGEDDRVIPVTAAKTLAAAIPGSKLIILPEVGHLFLAECPKRFYERVSEWLQHRG